MDGSEIRNWRAVNRVKQETLAAMLGISRVAVSKWESGLSRPSKVMALRLAEVISSHPKLRLMEEVAFILPQRQIKALARGSSMRLIGVSSGFKEFWPGMSEFIGTDTRRWFVNEAQDYAEGSDLLRQAIAGEVLMVTGVSNRILSIGDDVQYDFRSRWHAIVRRIDGELINELIFEPEAPGTPVGIKSVLRRADVKAMFE